MAEEKFGEAVARPEQIDADVLAAAEEIAGRFFLLGRNVDGRQGAGAIEDRELRGIAAVGFDASAGSTRNQRGRDDVTRDAVRRQGTLEFEAARAGFVAALDRSRAPQAFEEARIVGMSDVRLWRAGVRCPGSNDRGDGRWRRGDQRPRWL